MDRQTFNWIPESAPEKITEEPTPELTQAQKIWAKAKPFAPFIVFLLVLLALLLTHSGSTSNAATPSQSGAAPIDVLVPIFPLGRGQIVEPELLRMVPVRRKDLTPRQRIQAVQTQDLERLRGRVRAKKNLPPQQILYWSDLVLEDAVQVQAMRPRIHYSQGESHE